MVVSFLEDVEGKTIHPQKSDQWVWTVDPSGQYSVKSIHNMLRGEIMEEI